MARLCRPHEAPPDDFIYTQPDTGGRWTGENLSQLVGFVLEHRKWRGLKPDDYDGVRLDIERQICSGMPQGVCQAEEGENYQPFDDKARGLTVESLMDASGAALRFIQSGGALVDKAESERRANICRGCRFNRPSPCAICTPAFKLMTALVPSGRIELGLSACGLCGCSLQVKVLLPIETILSQDASQPYRFPQHCWLNENHGT